MEHKEQIQNKGKTLTGIVVGNTMKHTIKVEVTRTIQHPLYKKIIKKYKTYLVDADEATVSLGDVVTITEMKPMSKLKRFKLVRE